MDKKEILEQIYDKLMDNPDCLDVDNIEDAEIDLTTGIIYFSYNNFIIEIKPNIYPV